MPPLSVRMRVERASRLWNSMTSRGAMSFTLSQPPSSSSAAFWTSGFRWTGYTTFTSGNSSTTRRMARNMRCMGSPRFSRRRAVSTMSREPLAHSRIASE